jgi:SAM-dependent methyltransferase
MTPPATEFAEALSNAAPGRALDLACGSGRHSVWLRDRGWKVTAVDLVPAEIAGVTFVQGDLEAGFAIEPGAWDLIVCWLYWQENLLPAIGRGVKEGGYVALAGKTSGRFATSLANYHRAFPGWKEISSGEAESRAFYVAQAASSG